MSIESNGAREVQRDSSYERPTIRRLGRVADLTRSGTTGTPDGGGMSGGSGTVN
jgi:hypothetical protein